MRFSIKIKNKKFAILNLQFAILNNFRGVAQPGRAPASGAGGQRFKSAHPDHRIANSQEQGWYRELV